MCLILFAKNFHPKHKLILAANRDEFYDHPSTAAGYWNDFPDLLAGKDLKANGTWLGITRQGKIAAVTNYRDFYSHKDKTKFKSRGNLVTKYLTENFSPKEFSTYLSIHGIEYNGFNLIFGTPDELYHYSNISIATTKVENGIHGLSNHLLDTAWPKVHSGKLKFGEILSSNEISMDTIFNLMSDEKQFDDELLPDTGVGLEYERVLSSIFIKSPIYGTRSSTVITIDMEDKVQFVERTYNNQNGRSTFINHKFQIENRSPTSQLTGQASPFLKI